MSSQLSLLFARQFGLCGLKNEETLAVIAEIGKKRDHVEAAVLAAQQLGAAVILLESPSLSHPELPPHHADDRGVAALLAAAAECDMVLDLTVGGLIHSDVRTRIRDYFEAWNDPEVWALSHMGWGVHPAARFSAVDVYSHRPMMGQEFRSAEGNFMWSTGSNRFANRFTPAHLDIPMHNCTVMVDDTVVVDAGRLVGGNR